MGLTTGTTKTVSNTLTKEMSKSIEYTNEKEYTQTCSHPKSNFVTIYQWVALNKVTGELVRSKTFICTEGQHERPPQCPPGFCLDSNCQRCKGVFLADPKWNEKATAQPCSTFDGNHKLCKRYSINGYRCKYNKKTKKCN